MQMGNGVYPAEALVFSWAGTSSCSRTLYQRLYFPFTCNFVMTVEHCWISQAVLVACLTSPPTSRCWENTFLVSLFFVTNEHPRAADYKPASAEKYRGICLRGDLVPSSMGHSNFGSCICGSLYALTTFPAVARSSHLLRSSEEGCVFPCEQYRQKCALEEGRFHAESQNPHWESSWHSS